MRDEAGIGKTSEGDDLFDVAAAWHERLDEEGGSAGVRAEFDVWQGADARHRAVFDAVDRMWSGLREARLDPRILEIRRKALDAGIRRRVSIAQMIAAAAGVAAVAVAVAWWAAASAPVDWGTASASSGAGVGVQIRTLRTAVGERSQFVLPDGSAVTLDTRSRMEVRFTERERQVRLLAGQAWFQVAKSAARPFVVEAGAERITALGTAFDVRFDERRDKVQVTLAEGKVAVEAIRSPLATLLIPKRAEELEPGEALVASADVPVRKVKTDVAKVGSWRSGKLVFDNDTLAAAVEEVNRYSSVRIELAEAALGEYRVSGVFAAGHNESFVETVTGHYPIRVVDRGADRIVLARASTR